ncbi:hypothetical protein Trydic_g6560 [Trypoxylus dichotomus]
MVTLKEVPNRETKLALWFTCTCLIESIYPNVDDQTIVGGNDAIANQFPYQVSITENGYYKCGGSSIGNKWVLTAAHCVYDCLYLSFGGIQNDIANIPVHPKWNRATLQNDLVIIEIVGEFDFACDSVGPIQLERWYIKERDCVVSGWSLLYVYGINPDRLQFVKLKTLLNTESQRLSLSYKFKKL